MGNIGDVLLKSNKFFDRLKDPWHYIVYRLLLLVPSITLALTVSISSGLIWCMWVIMWRIWGGIIYHRRKYNEDMSEIYEQIRERDIEHQDRLNDLINETTVTLNREPIKPIKTIPKHKL